jgi:hypothetical protein
MGAIVIPKELRKKTLRLAHVGHPGMTATKSILRARVWWPKMNTEVEEWVINCMGCALTSNGERPAPMRATQLPTEPWSKLAIDFNGPHVACGGQSVAVLIDYYSRYMVARFVKSTGFSNLQPFLDEVFHLLGNPASI